MKFSEMISNQSHTGLRVKMWVECGARNPIPIPYSVNPLNRFAGIPVTPTEASKKEGQRSSPAPQQERTASGTLLVGWRFLLFVGHLRPVGCATALALARVLAFATIVTGLAAALALARVLALTSVLFLHLLVGLLLWFLSRSGSLRPGEQIGSLDAGASAREQARDRRTRE